MFKRTYSDNAWRAVDVALQRQGANPATAGEFQAAWPRTEDALPTETARRIVAQRNLPADMRRAMFRVVT